MNSPTPEPAPAPTGHEGFLERVRDWFEADIEPRLATAEAVIAKVKELAPELSNAAGILEELVKAVAPAESAQTATLIADAEQVAAVIARIVGELAAAGV